MRIRPLSTTALHPRNPAFGYSTNLTPHRHRKNERKVSTLPDFSDVHRSIAIDLVKYAENPRSNYVRLRDGWFHESAAGQAFLLAAHNMEARVFLAHVAAHHLRQHPELKAQPVFFVTISPRRYVLRRAHASRVDIKGLQNTTRQALAGCSLIGMVDFALFQAWGQDALPEWHNLVGVHTHSLVFGKTRAQIKAQTRKMGLDFINISGECAADVLKIKAGEEEGYLLYALKAPLFRYNVKQGKRLKVDPDTGEIFRRPNLTSYPLRKGDQLRMAGVLSDMYLDELLFGQGDGTAVVRDIRADALAPLLRRNSIAGAKSTRPDSQIAVKLTFRPSDRRLLSETVRNPFYIPHRWKQSLRVETAAKALLTAASGRR